MTLGTSRPRNGDNKSQLLTRIAMEHLATGKTKAEALAAAALWKRAKYAEVRAEFVRLWRERVASRTVP